ncbi:MAG: hypothetical protein ABH954_01600 [Candidatus Omnitrophota bacterium]
MRRKGQSTVEYALIIAVVLAAFLTMQHYIRRGVEGKMRDSADSIGSQFDERTSLTHTVQQHTPFVTTETFGIDKTSVRNIIFTTASGGTADEGLSYYEVTTGSKITDTESQTIESLSTDDGETLF